MTETLYLLLRQKEQPNEPRCGLRVPQVGLDATDARTNMMPQSICQCVHLSGIAKLRACPMHLHETESRATRH